jgi:hypothetical protein
MGEHSPAAVRLTDGQIALIKDRCAEGNRLLQDEFGIDLAALGYPSRDPVERIPVRTEDQYLPHHMIDAL